MFLVPFIRTIALLALLRVSSLVWRRAPGELPSPFSVFSKPAKRPKRKRFYLLDIYHIDGIPDLAAPALLAYKRLYLPLQFLGRRQAAQDRTDWTITTQY